MTNSSQETPRYGFVTSPIGELLIAVIGHEVVHLAFENHDFDRVVARLATEFDGKPVRDDAAIASVAAQLREYFAGDRRQFEVTVRQPVPNTFTSLVQQQLQTIPYGETRSYGELAQQLDRAGAARAVGSACAKNPVPIIQPCHRIVRSDGSYGQYSGTPEAKTYLLALERGETPGASTS